MRKVKRILEKKDVLAYLMARGLVKQYQKAKFYLLSVYQSQTRFNEKNPRGCGIWYFRINKQFRALGVFDAEDNLIIFEIDNHQ